MAATGDSWGNDHVELPCAVKIITTRNFIQFWTEAWSMAFSTCLPGYGILNWFAKYKTSVKGFYTLSWLHCLSVMTVTGLSFALVASEAGFLEKVSHITNYFNTVTDSKFLAVTIICIIC